jgi:C1A family cysteine protease
MTEASAYKCVRVHQVPSRDIDAIKNELSNERVVGIGIPVYKSWMNSGVVRKYGNITVPLPGEVPETIGHAVALVGFSDDPQFAGGGYFIVRNSWGMNWATASALGVGYGTIPYRYISNYNWDAWSIVA